MKAATLTLNPAIDRTMFFDGIFTAGELNRARATVSNAGSKGVNVSRALKIMGIDAVTYGFCGGANGTIFKEMLDSEGILYRFTETAAETRMNIKMTDSEKNCTEANEAGGPISDVELAELMDSLDAFFNETNSISTDNKQFFFIGGSIPRGVEKSVYKDIVSMGKKYGSRVILDCDGEALKQGMEGLPYLIKPNLFELSGYVGKSLKTIDEVVENSKRIYEEKGVSVLCTMGGDGSVYAGEYGFYTANTPKVELRGFTGAGDTYLASFIYELDRTGSAEQAMRFAASASAAKVELEGTAMPSFEAMRKYESMLDVTSV